MEFGEGSGIKPRWFVSNPHLEWRNCLALAAQENNVEMLQ
jgi:hypothetical protein